MGDPNGISGVERLRQQGISVNVSDVRADRAVQQLQTTLYEMQQGRGSVEDAERAMQRAAEASAGMPSGATLDRMQSLRDALTPLVEQRRREDSIDSVAGRSQPDYHSAIERDLSLGVRAMNRTGRPAAFADTLVRGGADARMRALGRMSESELRAGLSREGVTGDRADEAIDTLKGNIALRFERRVHRQAERRLGETARKLDRASIGQGPAFEQQLARLADPEGGQQLIGALMVTGATDEARQLIALAGQAAAHPEERAAIETQMRPILARALGTAAQTVRARYEDVRGGENNDATWAEASRAFPAAADQVARRWGADGLVAEGIAEHSAAVGEEIETNERMGKAILILSGVLVGSFAAVALSAGVMGTAAATAGMGVVREGLEVGTRIDQADEAAAESVAGLQTNEAVAQKRAEAAAATMAAPVAIAADTAAAVAIGGVHHHLTKAVGGAAVWGAKQMGVRAAIDGIAAAGDTAAAVGIDAAKHAAEAALSGTEHH